MRIHTLHSLHPQELWQAVFFSRSCLGVNSEQAPARARLSRRERPVAPSSEQGTLGFWLFYGSKWGQLSAFLGWLSQGRIREPGAALGERQLRTCCSAPGDCKHGTTGGIGE